MASRRYAEVAGRGALAGALAATVQVAIGWLLDRWLLPRGHDNNIAPRLVNRTLRRTRHRTNPVREWVLGTLFHYGYGLGWGALFGLVRRRSRLPNPVLGGLLGLAIYGLAFSGVGVGTVTGTERSPKRRPWQKEVSLVTVALTYALSLATFFARLERRGRRGERPRA